jgi:hypothetical protein
MKKLISFMAAVMILFSISAMPTLADGYPDILDPMRVEIGTTLQNRYLYRDNKEYYVFTIKKETDIQATVDRVPMFRKFTFNLIGIDGVMAGCEGTEADVLTITAKLNAGTYYLEVISETDDARIEPGELFYTFSLMEAVDYIGDPDRYEPNEFPEQATVLYSSAGIGGSASVAANLHDCVDVDYYEVTFADPSLVTITDESYSTEFEVYDANNQLLGSSAYQLSLDLDGGTYYIKVVRDSILNGDTFNLSYQLGVNVQSK